jgi:hypothetical protein
MCSRARSQNTHTQKHLLIRKMGLDGLDKASAAECKWWENRIMCAGGVP